LIFYSEQTVVMPRSRAEIKINGPSVQKSEWKQTVGQTDTTEFITLPLTKISSYFLGSTASCSLIVAESKDEIFTREQR